MKKILHLQPQRAGIIAQLVEQRTENPCVAGSIPADTTLKIKRLRYLWRNLFYYASRIGHVINIFVWLFKITAELSHHYALIERHDTGRFFMSGQE